MRGDEAKGQSQFSHVSPACGCGSTRRDIPGINSFTGNIQGDCSKSKIVESISNTEAVDRPRQPRDRSTYHPISEVSRTAEEHGEMKTMIGIVTQWVKANWKQPYPISSQFAQLRQDIHCATGNPDIQDRRILNLLEDVRQTQWPLIVYEAGAVPMLHRPTQSLYAISPRFAKQHLGYDLHTDTVTVTVTSPSDLHTDTVTVTSPSDLAQQGQEEGRGPTRRKAKEERENQAPCRSCYTTCSHRADSSAEHCVH